jgi:hypothetical protein
MYPLDRSGTGDYPHHSLSCNVVNSAQMLIIGGTFPLSTDCDASEQWGAHNLDLGKQNDKHSPWELYSPQKTSYVVPEEVLSVIGGAPTGGATKTAPINGFSNNDLRVLMPRKASVAVRTPTRNVTPGGPTGPSLSTGAIIGIAVGGGIALIAALILCFCLIRRHRRHKYPNSSSAPSHSHQGSHAGLGPHQAAWSPNSSHYTPSSPFPTHSPFLNRPQTVPPYAGPPVELPVGSNQFPTGFGGQGGYFSENPGPGGHDASKYDAQGNAWVAQVSMVQTPPGHRRTQSSHSASPLHDNIAPVPPVAGYQYQQYNSPVGDRTSPAPPTAPQELDPHSGVDEREGRSPRHQTYYHP